MGFLSKLLSVFSGNRGLKVSEQLLFDKVIGFRGIVPGVGTSTIVQNTAIALSETTNLAVCILDTNFLYPTQYPLLVANLDGKSRKDFLDFTGELSDITVETAYKNVSLVGIHGRTVIDMVSPKDNEEVVTKVIGALKSYYDIILVDLSYEPTNVSIHSAIKCNRVINIADQSLKCIYNMRKSLNSMVTLGVPLAKANKIVLNKVLPDVITNTKGVIEEASLELLGEIPFSVEIAKQGVAGKKIWGKKSSNRDSAIFSEVIETIIDSIVTATPLNASSLGVDVENLEIEEQKVETPKKKRKNKDEKVVSEAPKEESNDIELVEDDSFITFLDEEPTIGGVIGGEIESEKKGR